MHRQRDIVLVPIPFTDLTSQKKRPVVIISSDTYNSSNEDMVVVAITSNMEPRVFSLLLTRDELEDGILKATSMIRADKIYTLHQSIVAKTFGRVKPEILEKIKDCFAKLTQQPLPSSKFEKAMSKVEDIEPENSDRL